MSREDYEKLAEIFGEAFDTLSDEDWRKVYDALYCPVTDWLASENPRFDHARFSYAVASKDPTKAFHVV